MRISYAYQAVASSGEDFETQGQPLLSQLQAMDDSLNSRLDEKYGFTKDDMDKPLPLPQQLLAGDEALVDYFITRKWRADRESADPLEDERLYAIVTRKDQAPRLYDLGDPRQIIPAAQSQQMASLRSTPLHAERGAVPLIDLNAAFAGLYDRPAGAAGAVAGRRAKHCSWCPTASCSPCRSRCCRTTRARCSRTASSCAC